jgi:hypothetical protein
MFPHRIAVLNSPEDVGASGTKVIDLDLSETISQILIKFKATNLINSSTDTPFSNLTKIEIVDGSDVLFTMNGDAADAVAFYDHNKAQCTSWTYLANWALEALVGINFGRYPFDPVYALDPTKFRNLQLKITYDEDVGSSTAEVNALEVWALVFSGKTVTPVGFFQCKEQYAYTPSANSYEEIELPTDLMLRTLYLQAKKKDTWFGSIVDEVRLDEDALKALLFDNEYYDVMKMYRAFFGRYEHKTSVYLDTTDTPYYRGPTADVAGIIVPYGTAEYAVADGQIFGAEGAGYMTTAGNCTILCSGYLPNYVGAIPFGKRGEPEDWYDPRGVEKLRFRVKGGTGLAGTETFRVLTQQVRLY